MVSTISGQLAGSGLSTNGSAAIDRKLPASVTTAITATLSPLILMSAFQLARKNAAKSINKINSRLMRADTKHWHEKCEEISAAQISQSVPSLWPTGLVERPRGKIGGKRRGPLGAGLDRNPGVRIGRNLERFHDLQHMKGEIATGPVGTIRLEGVGEFRDA